MHTLFLLGDSTCAIKEDRPRPETGWGEMLYPYIADGWEIRNLAVNGMSTRSCIDRGVFQKALDEAEPEDAAIIQFGHNESKPDERHTEPWAGYAENLVYMAENLRKKGVDVYFVTSIPRRKFVGGLLSDTHKDYIAAMKYAAYRASVSCVDITLPAMMEYQKMGEEKTKSLHMNFGPGLYPGYPEGRCDDTHLRPEGAVFYAALIASELSKLDPLPQFLDYHR